MKREGNTKRKGKIKIIVLCDDRGGIQSVAIPNPKIAERINMQVDTGGRVHRLEVDGSVITPEILLGVRGEDARKNAYDILRAMIE